MGEFVGVVVFVLIMMVVLGAKKQSSASTNNRLLASGVPARGILLQVSMFKSGSVGFGLSKYQLRNVTIDVEVPGKPPYEVTTTAMIPFNLVRDVVPGATVELRVDPTDRTQIAIVGPGVGFNTALLMTQGQSNQGAA